MASRPRRGVAQSVQWWWSTRVLGWWRVKVLGAADRARLATGAQWAFERDAAPLAAPAAGITVILTAYKRAEYLAAQIAALRAQSVPPAEIWVWCNRADDKPLLDVSALADRVVVSNTNWLFWGRFALGQLARTEHVAFFDDDVLPEPRWFESCLAQLKQGGDAILGGSGVILPTDGGYSSKRKAGWNGLHSDAATPVDLVGHAWFLRKRHLQYMWREEPVSWDNGEDIHLSYMALKHGGIETRVPPHPESDPTLWSCRPDFGKQVGRLAVATYKTVDHRDTRSMIVDAYRRDGWVLACERHPPAALGAAS
jgi:glycosyltransferase involved in cell wall biosynthesis